MPVVSPQWTGRVAGRKREDGDLPAQHSADVFPQFPSAEMWQRKGVLQEFLSPCLFPEKDRLLPVQSEETTDTAKHLELRENWT